MLYSQSKHKIIVIKLP